MELVGWEEAMQGAGAETSCQDASAGGLLEKSNCRRGVVVASVLTKNDKPSGSLTEPLL